MALGKRKREEQGLWIATTDLPKSPGHPFYQKLNDVLAEADFDRWIEERCQPYYAAKLGRPRFFLDIEWYIGAAGQDQEEDGQQNCETLIHELVVCGRIQI